MNSLIRAYQTHGHLIADIDPLKLREVYKDNESLANKFRFPDAKMTEILDYASYGFTKADLEKTFTVSASHTGSILK